MNKFKYLMILFIILISFTLLNVSFASDNSTEYLELNDKIELESVGFDYEDSLSIDENNILNSSNNEVLSDYVPYSGDNIVNPSFEDGLNGWNYTEQVFINNAYVHNGGRAIMVYPDNSVSQKINFNTIDEISIWFNSYTFLDVGAPYDKNYFECYSDDELLFNSTLPVYNYINHCIDVSNITGWHTFKIKMAPLPKSLKVSSYHTYIDDIRVVRNDAIDSCFNIGDISLDEGISVKFIDKSFGYISSWLWDFGDGSISEEKNPTHIYKNPGIYNISLTISNGNNFSQINKTINLKDILSVDFTGDVVVGFKNLTVSFNDSSNGDIDEWLWDFGDGTNSREKNPIHYYSDAGYYNVTLTVSNAVKSLNITKSNFIIISDDLIADFNSSSNGDSYSYVVEFNDLSKGNPTSWLWDFGDGTNCSEKNPTHKYLDVGTYNVSLTIYSNFNTTKTFKTITVKVKESYIDVVNITKRLIVNGILKDQNGVAIPNEFIIFNFGDVENKVATEDDGTFKIQGNPNCSLTMIFNGNNNTLSCKSIITLGDFDIKNTTISVSNPYKLVTVDSAAGENGKYLTFYLRDSDGNVLPYKTIGITFNGVNYNVTSSFDGKVNLPFKFSKSGTYNLKILFLGDDDYNKTTKTVKITVSKKSMKIVPKKTSYIFKKSSKTKYVKATLKTSNKYLKIGKKVTLTINGKKFSAKAGKNGAIVYNIASIKKTGTFKVKIKFAGDSIYSSATSNTIKIKIK